MREPKKITPVGLPDHRLTVVPPGPDAVLPVSAEIAIGEWIDGWLAAKRLERVSIPLPVVVRARARAREASRQAREARAREVRP